MRDKLSKFKSALLVKFREILDRNGYEGAVIHPTETGTSGVTFRIDFKNSELFLKKLDERQFSIAKALNSLLLQNDIPVPVIIALDRDTKTGESYIITEAAIGKDLVDSEISDELMRRCGSCLRSIHNIVLPGYGELVLDQAVGLTGRHQSLKEMLAQLPYIQGHFKILDQNQLIDLKQWSRVLKVTEDLSRAEVGSSCLLHNDFTKRNIFSSDEHVSAVIDWETAKVGAPEYDLAICQYASTPDSFSMLLEGYGNNYDEERLLGYSVLVAVQKVALGLKRNMADMERRKSKLLASLADYS